MNKNIPYTAKYLLTISACSIRYISSGATSDSIPDSIQSTRKKRHILEWLIKNTLCPMINSLEKFCAAKREITAKNGKVATAAANN